VVALAGLHPLAGPSATPGAPSYPAAGIFNTASRQAGAIAPNTFVTILGSDLAYTTRALTDADLRAGMLPSILPGTGVSVFINHIRAHVFYVSPDQLIVLVPADAFPGPGELQVDRNGLYGPPVPITLQPTAPALFQADDHTAVAAHSDGGLLTDASPARPGEAIVLYATGLGATAPPIAYGEIPRRRAALSDSATFQVLLDGDPSARVSYAGAEPGFAGLYRIDLQLPSDLQTNPEIRIQAGDVTSPPNIRIPLKGNQ